MMLAIAAVGFGQLDPFAVKMIDGADMDAIGADNVHMLTDLCCIGHGRSPLKLPTITDKSRIGCIVRAIQDHDFSIRASHDRSGH